MQLLKHPRYFLGRLLGCWSVLDGSVCSVCGLHVQAEKQYQLCCFMHTLDML